MTKATDLIKKQAEVKQKEHQAKVKVFVDELQALQEKHMLAVVAIVQHHEGGTTPAMDVRPITPPKEKE